MRTTLRLDPEVAAAAERLRRERHIGLGEAGVGLRVDATDIAGTLELLDQYDAGDAR